MRNEGMWVLFFICVLAMVGCTQTEDTWEKAKEEGRIVVGFANERPFAYKGTDGRITGEAVEIARRIFAKLGIAEVEPVLADFGSLIQGLHAGRFDAITAGMYIKPERCKQVLFADPEYQIEEALAVKEGNPKQLTRYEDIAKVPDATIAVMRGAIEVDYMRAVGVKEEQMKLVPDQPSAISLLESGRVDAITMTGPSMRSIMDSAKPKGIEQVVEFEQPVINGESVVGYGAAAFRKEDQKIRDAFTQELDAMERSGELLEIMQPFGFTEKNLPGDVTAAKLCK